MHNSFLLLALALPSSRATAETMTRAEYHPSANLFAVMDEVAYRKPGFNGPAHREAWTERYGWSAEDEAISARYKDYRERTFDDSDQADETIRRHCPRVNVLVRRT